MDLLAALLCAKVSVFPFMHCWQCLLETPHDRIIQLLHFSSSLLHLLRNRLYLGGLPPHVRAPGGGHPHNCTPCSPSLPPSPSTLPRGRPWLMKRPSKPHFGTNGAPCPSELSFLGKEQFVKKIKWPNLTCELEMCGWLCGLSQRTQDSHPVTGACSFCCCQVPTHAVFRKASSYVHETVWTEGLLKPSEIVFWLWNLFYGKLIKTYAFSRYFQGWPKDFVSLGSMQP